MPIVLVGRTHNHVGKRLWEIIGSLKDYGVGRMVIRSTHERYLETSYYRILSARPEMDTGKPYMCEDNKKGKVLVDEVFRGRKVGVSDISKSAYKTDFKLVPKHEEYKYVQAAEEYTLPEKRIFPQTVEMPPLLKILAERENHASKDLKLLIKETSLYRMAEDGETPTVQIHLGLGTPASPQLYEGVLENK